MKNEPILSCKDLCKEFPLKKAAITGRILSTLRAVDHVSLALVPGDTLGIVGESGSGKSTTGEMLGDLQRPTSGTVYYKGQDIRSLTPEQYADFRRNVQFIFQDPKGSMNPNYRIEQILEEPLITLGLESDPRKRHDRVVSVCASVGLEQSVLKKYPSELSGGQCQRIAIGRALITEPKVIICDEAVSALDVSVQAQILNLLRDIQDRLSIAYLFISHDIGVVNYMADTIAVMLNGKVVEEGTAEEVLHHPQSEYTRQLLSSTFNRQ